LIFIKTSVLEPLKREIISQEDFDTLIDFLQEYYPNGFEVPTDIYTMFGRKIEVEDYDHRLGQDDIIVWMGGPGFTALLARIIG
jgi:hypothetical protein